MRQTIGWLVSLVVCLGLAVPDLAAQGKGGAKGNKGGESDGGGTISVCVEFRDVDTDRIRADNFSKKYCDGSGGVLAIVGKKRGGFRLDTNNKGRKVSLNFSDCVPGETCTSPFPTGTETEDVDLRIGEEYEFDAAAGKRLPTGQKLDIVEMDGGETAFGALVITFAPTGRPAKLQFKVVFGQAQFLACPDGDPVTVTRGEDAGNPTNSWTLSAAAGDVACLFKVVDNFKEVTREGRFNLPFSIDVEEQP
jgi:hypothetical protein